MKTLLQNITSLKSEIEANIFVVESKEVNDSLFESMKVLEKLENKINAHFGKKVYYKRYAIGIDPASAGNDYTVVQIVKDR